MFLKFRHLLDHLICRIKLLYTLRKTKPPFRRQGTTATKEVIAFYGIERIDACKYINFRSFCRDVYFHRIGVRPGVPTFIGIAIFYLCRNFSIFPYACPYIIR
ncbi:hypothetical protein D3C81_896590 [compost metagenome]